MRCLRRNKTPIYYALFQETEKIVGDDGYRTGEKEEVYTKPDLLFANVSPASGISSTEIFGNSNDYSRVIVTDKVKCPIDENSVLWVDIKPVFDSEGNTETPHDYVVKHVARSFNFVSYAIDKVKKQ